MPPGVDAMQTEAHEGTLALRVPGQSQMVDTELDPAAVPELRPTLVFTAPTRQLVLKRTVDIVGASILVLLVLPLFVIAAVGVRMTSPGPIFFRQTRVGRDGRTFTMLKFRTYPVEHVDSTIALPVDTCPSRWGRLLRRTSIDELPQFLNVLKGDMSLVGPRPERPHIATPLAIEHPEYRERHRMPSGITGLAQIRGLVGTTSITDRIDADNEYIDGWRFRRDISILVRTLPAVVKKLRW